MGALRVLGLDPGLTRCGVGVVDGPPGRASLVAAELVRTSPDQPLEQRLARVHAEVTAAIVRHRPAGVAVERVLFSNNARSAMGTGQALGVALLAAAQAGLAVTQYSPNEVKQAVTGDGAATKDAVGRMVARQLRLDDAPRPADVADAVAVALCHLGRARVATLTAAASAGATRLAEAERAARARGRGGWEAVVARRQAAAAREVSR